MRSLWKVRTLAVEGFVLYTFSPYLSEMSSMKRVAFVGLVALALGMALTLAVE